MTVNPLKQEAQIPVLGLISVSRHLLLRTSEGISNLGEHHRVTAGFKAASENG